ncbi:hypothetical protein Tco_1017112 [Tanacetum coccineum]|uniref:Uncharacterized protein n=1 Tax=Tanacetum coccineum TaxID=301880 RepID=A0ABQ5FT56_9ASTR
MAAKSNVPQLVDKKGDSYFAIAPRLEARNFNKWKKANALLFDWNGTLLHSMFVYEDNLISRRYLETKKALITTPSTTSISTTFFSNNIIQDFQENYDDEVDERTIEKYLRDLDIKFHERALLAGSKHFIKRKNIFSSQKANENRSSGFPPKFTPKLIQSSQQVQSSQNEPKISKDYKTEYKKGLVAETFDWDKEEVSDDEKITLVKVLMALADDELAVRKNLARNGEWIDITVRKGASPCFEVMPLNYQDHSPRERPGLGTMKHTKPKTQESSSKSISGPITVCNTLTFTSSVPTKVKNTKQESKIDEMIKPVQMLMDEKINST